MRGGMLKILCNIIISYIYENAVSLFLAMAMVFIFFGCGGGGGKTGADIPPPSTAVETPQETSLAVAVEGLAANEQRTILLSDAQGNKITEAQTVDGKAFLETFIRQSESGFFRVRIQREGLPDLDTAVQVQAGQKGIAVQVTPATTLASLLGRAFNASGEEGLKRAVHCYGEIIKTLARPSVENAILELENLPKNPDLNTLKGGTSALQEVLRQVFARIHTCP
jgi:hypothetical protein